MSDTQQKRKPFILRLLKNPFVIMGAMAAGILTGVFAPESGKAIAQMGKVYLDLLTMTIFPILITAIVASVGNVFAHKEMRVYLSRILAFSLLFLVITSVIAVVYPLVLRPGSGLGTEARTTLGKALVEADQSGTGSNMMLEDADFINFLGQLIPRNIFESLGSGRSLQILFFSILLGVATGILKPEQQIPILTGAEALFKAFFSIIEWIMYLLPFGLYGLMAGQIASSGLGTILAMGKFVLVAYLVSFTIFLASAVIIAVTTRVGIGRAIGALKDSLLIAFGTQSTFASMPSTIEGLTEGLGVDEELVQLVVPLGAVINRFSMVITYGVATVFAAQLYGVPLGIGQIGLTLLLIIIAAIAGAGTPGIVSLAMISIVFTPLGLPSSALLVLLLAINPVVEPVTTMTNIYAVAATTTVIASKGRNN